jgi:hypothetical protein
MDLYIYLRSSFCEQALQKRMIDDLWSSNQVFLYWLFIIAYDGFWSSINDTGILK